MYFNLLRALCKNCKTFLHLGLKQLLVIFVNAPTACSQNQGNNN